MEEGVILGDDQSSMRDRSHQRDDRILEIERTSDYEVGVLQEIP
jgi:hypothetical protein